MTSLTWGTRRPRSTRTRRSRYPAKTTTKWGSKKYRKPRTRPSRFLNPSTYRKTRALTNQLRNISETHLIPLTQFDQSPPYACTGNNYCFFKGFCTGTGLVPAQLTNFESLGGFAYPADVRGNHIFHRKLSVMFQVDMSASQATTSITEFRVIQFRQKRTASVGLMDPEEQLFLETDGSYMGWNTAPPVPPTVGGATGPKLMVAKTNKQKFVILKDFKFTLTSPQILGTGAQTAQSFNSRYPSMKRFSMNVPVFDKFTLDTNNHPADYDFTTCCVILARPLANTNLANDFTVSTMNGVSTFTDF